MKFKGWKYEHTALIRTTGTLHLKQALVEVCLSLPSARTRTIESDLRVVLKPEWNRYGMELPFQLLGCEMVGDTHYINVAFFIDLQPGEQQRIGFLYDNPEADKTVYQSDREVTCHENSLAWSIATPRFRLSGNSRNRMPECITTKFNYLEGTFPRDVLIPSISDPGVIATLAVEGETVVLSEANSPDAVIEDCQTGAVCTLLRKKATLGCSRGQQPSDAPILITDYCFYNEKDWFTKTTRLFFPKKTAAYRVELDTAAFDLNRFSHYAFRPVSGKLLRHDVEEVGHVLLDPQYGDAVVDGLVMGRFLPENMAWDGLIQIRKGSRVNRHAYVRLHLDPPNQSWPRYAPFTALVRGINEGVVRLARCPIYAANLGNPANTTPIPAGTEMVHTSAHLACEWTGEAFAQTVEGLGRVLNQPIEVELHPQVPFMKLSSRSLLRFIPQGGNGQAYLQPGVR